jgi:hypothetical protein
MVQSYLNIQYTIYWEGEEVAGGGGRHTHHFCSFFMRKEVVYMPSFAVMTRTGPVILRAKARVASSV